MIPALTDWRPADLLPGLYLLLLAGLLTGALKRWYDPVPGRVLAVFAGLLLALFGPVLLGGGILLPLDNLRHAIPLQHLAPPETPGNLLQSDLVVQIAPTLQAVRHALRAGEWPLWDPAVGSGMPLLADPQSQVLQPFVALALPLPLPQAFGVTAALRVLVALLFTYLFLVRLGLRRGPSLLGAVTYGTSGFLLLWVGWPLANAAALVPVLLYAVCRLDAGTAGRVARRDILLFMVALTALWAGGQPEVGIYALALVLAFFLQRLAARPRGRRLALAVPALAAVTVSAALAAPALLPTALYLPQTERSQAVAAARATASWAALGDDAFTAAGRARWARRAVERVVPNVAPNAWGNNRYGAYWGSTVINQDAGAFVGGTALLLALLGISGLGARRRRPGDGVWWGGALVGILAVAQPPALSRLLLHLPAIGAISVHANQRILFAVAFSLAVLAAGTAEWLTAEGSLGARRFVLLWAAALAALVTWAYLAHPSPVDPGTLAGFRQAWWLGQVAVFAAAALLLITATTPAARRRLPLLLTVLVAGELLAAHGPANPPMPRRLAFPLTPPLAFLRQHLVGGDRMAGLGAVLPPNLAAAYDLPDIRVYNPMAPERYEQALDAISSGRTVNGSFPRLDHPEHPLYDFLGVRWLLTAPQPPGFPDLPDRLRLALRHPDGWIWERPSPLPRLFLPRGAEPLHPREGGAPWTAWIAGGADLRRWARIEPGASWRAARPAASAVEVLGIEPARIRARAELAEPRLLVASLTQDGGWHLLADGRPLPTILADGPFVAAWLTPGGAGTLELLYRPPGFLAGCLLAALALALGAAGCLPPPRRRIEVHRGDDGPDENRRQELEEQAGEVRQDVEPRLET